MSRSSSFDRESFQQLLANAFVVQECGLETPSLLALAELQRLIAQGEPDVDRVLNLIADRARQVADASGVALGMLEANRLVHRAGSGSAAALVGRQVTAVLSASIRSESRSEILRVENAQTDTRIEADVCRQLEAQSLLILPIYHRGIVAGAIEIFFDHPHVFQDREVRIYRLMSEIVEDVVLNVGVKQERTLAMRSEAVSADRQNTLPAEETGADDRFALWLAPESWIDRVCRTFSSVVVELASRWRPAEALASVNHRFKRITLPKFRWNVAATAVAAAFVLSTFWVMHDRRPASVMPNSRVQESNQIPQEPAPVKLSAPVTLEDSVLKARTAARGSGVAKAVHSASRWVRVGPNEVDYIADDVTIRRFTPKHAASGIRGYRQVSVGDDVTVRYFASKPAMVSETRPASTADPSQVDSPVLK